MLAGRLLLRIGVNTGDVIATTDAGRGDFLITGDAVNVAARLEQTAASGEVLASERTAAAAQASFLFGEARAVEVKGKSRPLRVFPLAGQRPARQMGRPPLVGRKQDLAPLALLCDRALEERHPQFLRRLKEVAARLG